MPNPAYTVEDFCKDPHFISWVLAPTEESSRFWQSFMVQYPQKVPDIQIAIGYISTMRFQEMNPSPQDLDRLKQRIWSDIDKPAHSRAYPVRDHPVRDHPRPDGPVRIIQWVQRPYRVAAAVVLLVASAALGWWAYTENSSLTYQTAYGKVQEIKLADGSLVTLNANSQLRVTDNIAGKAVREVWLDGEAFFDIAKRKGATFIVHTPEAHIEVLGTEFNVNTRRDQTHVVLEEGKVQLSTDNQSTVVMKPGDMATVSTKNRQIQLKRVQPDNYDAWKESYIILDGKSVSDIVNDLQDTFGVTITLQDSLLANKTLTGKLRTDVADECIENLAIILDADVKKAGDTYQFR